MKCDLYRLRRQVVVYDMERFFGEDDLPFDPILVVGEAPGEQEDAQGRPFVGPSGKLLRESVLAPAGVRDVVMIDVCACRPPRNRVPVEGEIKMCAPRVVEIVSACNPSAVLFVGKTAHDFAARIITSTGQPLFADVLQAHVVHPSYILRSGWPTSKRSRELVEQSVGAVKRLLRKVEEARRAKAQANGDHGGTDGQSQARPAHQHEYVAIGHWQGPGGASHVPLRACACGDLEAPVVKRGRRGCR